MPVSIPKLSRQNDEDAPGTEALIAAAAEKPEDNTDNLPIANGTFWVKQTHLGFCPTDVMLQIRPKGIVLLNDDYQVVEYKYANLVMWTQSRSSVTLMLQSNLKRIVLKARGRLAARKIVVMLHDVTQMLQRELHRKKAFWGLTSLDLEGVEMSESSVWMPTQSSQFESADSAQDSVEGVKMFRVKQTHMPEHPAHVMLRIDQHGLSLCHRETGEQLWSCGWGTILMWRADDAAVVLVFTESNRQIELLCPTSQDILDTMTAKTQAVARAMQGETHIHHSFGHTDKRLPKAPLEFRRELLTFEAPTVQHHERWKLMNGQTGLRGIFSLRNHQNMLESVKAREQLHAIFSVADSDGSGSLDVGEVGELLRSLNIYAKDGTEFQRHDIQLMMIDMDAFGNEVTFDGFVHWALSSTSGAGASELLKKRVEHRKKEVAAIGQIFDQLDQDGDGMLDRADFKEFVSCVGLSLNDKEFYQTWGSLDRDRGGEISFEEFFRWYKRQTIDQILVQLQRSLRLTRLLANAKGAMVYAVDQGNQRGKVALQSLFDCVDNVGTELITHEDLMALVHDLRIDADEYDVIMAMREIDQSGKGKIDLKKWTKWWCNSPSDSASAILRSKMKLAAFTAKDSGPMLQVVGTTDAGAGSAEGYLNELLQAAFAQKSDLQGRSLGIFGPKAHFRIWCSHLIQNPLTDRVLVVAIFGNVALMAAQTPGQDSTVGLAVVNFGLMVVFTAEMGLRIVANGLVFGETAYLTNSWDLFDCVIISAVWVIYVASLYFDIDKSVGFGLAMLRSFRALRFFSHIRNILGSIIAGRVMIGSVLLLLAFLFMLTYVIGFQLFAGVMDTTCGPSGGCPGCGMLTECPSTLDCTALYPGGHACYSLSIMNETLQNTTAPRAAPTFGFDTFGTSVLTVGSIITFDGWFDISVQMRQAQVAMRYWAWPAFASAVVWIGLFTVNLFLAGLAYSFIKVRKTTRNLDAHGALKKTLVERMLNDKATSGQDDEKGRHLLQLLHPPATRRARQLVNNSWFLNGLLLTVLVNVGFMAADHHNPSEQTQLTFAIAEAIFTAIYTFEMCTKLQAMGVLEYFKISLNRLDFIIVMASLSSYWLLLFKDESSNAKGSAVLRMLRVTKVIRAARVAKIIFRSDAVKQMTAKAFAGLDAIISLLVFIVFMLTLAAIAGMQLFHNCSDGTDPAMSHTPNFETFWQSLLVAWQVMTLDSWTSIMIDYMDCAGNVAAVYFVVIASTCAFVLGNLFVAIL
jgi:Ca2+-binding EF-hand superfamily protein